MAKTPALPDFLAQDVSKVNVHTPMFTAMLFTIASSIWKQTKCPSIDEWIKMWYIYTVECYSAIEKNETLPFLTTWT